MAKQTTGYQKTKQGFHGILQDRDLVAEAMEFVRETNPDFTVGGYRFVHSSYIAELLAEEIANDEYCLGCFKAEFIAECTGWPLALIQAAQKGEAYEALGKALIQEGKVERMAELYARYDGYGHHFATYDGHEHEVGEWHIFRVD